MPRKSHLLVDVLKKIHWCALSDASSIELCIYKSDMRKIRPPSRHILEANNSIIGGHTLTLGCQIWRKVWIWSMFSPNELFKLLIPWRRIFGMWWGSVHVHETRRTGLRGVMDGYTCVVGTGIVMDGEKVQWLRTEEGWHDGGTGCRQWVLWHKVSWLWRPKHYGKQTYREGNGFMGMVGFGERKWIWRLMRENGYVKVVMRWQWLHVGSLILRKRMKWTEDELYGVMGMGLVWKE